MSNMARLQGAGWTLAVEQHGEWMETGCLTLDPAWRYTDRAGHEHHGRALLVEKQDDPEDPPFMFDVDGEEYNADSHYECRLCGEWITPGTWFAPPQWVPTYRTAEVTLHLSGQVQRWVLRDSDLVQQLVQRAAVDPDISTAEVATIVQAAGEEAASLVEMRQS